MRFAVSMPQRFRDGEFAPVAFRAFLGRAEALGFDSAWTQGQLLSVFPVAVFGGTAACVDGVREVIDAGAEMILFTPLHDEAAQLEQLAAEVIPQLS